MSEWQDIASAPKDGTRVLAVWGAAGFGEPAYVGIAQWRGASSYAAHWTVDGRWMPGPDPELWQPLPDAPARKGE